MPDTGSIGGSGSSPCCSPDPYRSRQRARHQDLKFPTSNRPPLDALHGEERNDEVRLYAFDLLSDDGVDMRNETLQVRKLWLGKLLKRPVDGIIYNDHEAGAIGPRLFE